MDEVFGIPGFIVTDAFSGEVVPKGFMLQVSKALIENQKQRKAVQKLQEQEAPTQKGTRDIPSTKEGERVQFPRGETLEDNVPTSAREVKPPVLNPSEGGVGSVAHEFLFRGRSERVQMK